MAGFQELKARSQPEPEKTTSGGYFGWEVTAAVQRRQAEREASRHPLPPPHPFAPPPPAGARMIEDALIRSHAAQPSRRELRRQGGR